MAAYCPEPKSLDLIRPMIGFDPASRCFLSCMEHGLYIPRFQNQQPRELAKKYTREDVAGAAQIRLEEVVCALVASLEGTGLRIGLAGGLFANTKLNQRICAMDSVAEVFVFPNMGDGGLSVGAAWLAWHRETGTMPKPMRTMLLGTSPSEAEMEAALKSSGLAYSREDDIETKVAELLAKDNVVTLFNGPMEFGPRALCNRSILYPAKDPTVNDWLNRRLCRSEFMPFAPVTLAEYADQCYVGLAKAPVASRYMTVTFDCTERMQKESPAAIHVDRTARPQVVRKEDYPRIHAILTAYHALTGIPSVINTSFNMHEEPIVCTPDDAIRAFKASSLPFMAMGPFLVQGYEAIIMEDSK